MKDTTRTKKIIAGLLITVLSVQGLAACNSSVVEPETSATATETSAVETTQAPTPTPMPTATPTPTPTIAHNPHQKIKEYEALKDCKYGITNIRVFPDGDLVVTTRNDMINGNYNGKNDGTISLHVIDAKEDKEIAKAKMTPTADILGTTRDGRIVTYDSDGCDVTLWSKDLTSSTVIGKADYGCTFDQENEQVVFARYGSVCKMTLDGNVTRYMDKLYSTRCLNYDPQTDKVILATDDDNYDQVTSYALLNLADNAITNLTEDENFANVSFCKDKVLLNYPYENKSYIEVRNVSDGVKTACYKFKSGAEITTSSLTGKMLVNVPLSYSYNFVKKAIYLADPVTGKYCDTGITLKDLNQLAVTYDKYTEHFFIADSVKQKSTKARIIELCPECFELTEDMKTGDIEHFVKAEDKYSLGDAYKDLRTQADGLEKQFGVRILIGNEILNRNISYSYKLTSMEKSQLTEEDQLSYAGYALEIVQRDLEKYPEGFFEKFRNFKDEGGVCFALVDRLVNEHGDFLASGEFVFRGSTSYIVLDSNMINPSTVHHELWHAAENIISITDPEAFNDEEWNKLNPGDFKYTEDFEKYDKIDYSYMCKEETFEPDHNDIYFARQYGTVFPKEDRATIIEAFMGDENWHDPDKYTSCLDEINSFPHLKAKVDYMGDKCEKVFGYKYWET